MEHQIPPKQVDNIYNLITRCTVDWYTCDFKAGYIIQTQLQECRCCDRELCKCFTIYLYIKKSKTDVNRNTVHYLRVCSC